VVMLVLELPPFRSAERHSPYSAGVETGAQTLSYCCFIHDRAPPIRRNKRQIIFFSSRFAQVVQGKVGPAKSRVGVSWN